MEPRYFINKDLQVLKTFAVLFAALPLCMLLYLYMTPELENRAEMLKVFACVSLVMVLLSVFAWKTLDALPGYYLSLHKGEVSIPLAGFLKWEKGTHVSMNRSAIEDVIYDAKTSSSNLVVVLPTCTDIVPGNMVLGHMRFEKEEGQTRLVLCGIKKRDALKWQKLLTGSPVIS